MGKKDIAGRLPALRSFRGSGEEFAALAPKLTEQEMQAINGLFRAFIFKITRKGEYWTSCCRKHVILSEERTVTAEMRELLDVPHTPEPQFRYYKLLNPESETRAVCPHCGAEVTVKELGRTGRRGNLWSYVRAVVLRWHRGSLWAVGVEAKKTYNSPSGPMDNTWNLTAWPHIQRCAIARFRPGMAESITRGWWGDAGWPSGVYWQTGPSKSGLPFKGGDLFGYCAEYGTSYDVIGWEEIQKSPFRYVGIREIKQKTGTSPARLLTMACFYAGQMEMLHKFGLDRVIERFAARGVQTAWLFDWHATERKRFLKLPVKTVVERLEIRADEQCSSLRSQNDRRVIGDLADRLEALRLWKLRKGRDDFEDVLWEVCEMRNKKQLERVRARMTAFGVTLERVRHYLMHQQRAGQSVAGVEQLWTDYLDAAEHLGLDLNNDVIRFPRNLLAAHDERCATWAELQRQRKLEEDIKRAEEHRKATVERYNKLRKQYEFVFAGLRIVIPTSPDEIIREGAALKHCVGGYATRHAEGKTTILFLRRTDQPEKSLVTIEMNGKQLRQAHGWKNEMEGSDENPGKLPPPELYGYFFEPWLDWVKRGSPRDKDGKPKMKKKRGTENQSTTERKAG